MTRLSNILSFGVAQGLQFSLSAENIYKKDETMIMGLVWGLILKFQVGRKTELLRWITSLLQCPIPNLDSAWKDGQLFCQLVDKLVETKTGTSPPGDYPTGDQPEDALQRIRYAFGLAEEQLEIQEMLSPEDVIAGHLDERSNLTYLSIFYKLYHDPSSVSLPVTRPVSDPDVVHDVPLDRIPELEARIRQLEEELSQRNQLLSATQEQMSSLVTTTHELQQDVSEQKEANRVLQKKLESWELQLPFHTSPSLSNRMAPPGGDCVSLVVIRFCDAERYWEEQPTEMSSALQRFHSQVRDVAKVAPAYEVPAPSDQLMFAFEHPWEAVSFSTSVQHAVAEIECPAIFHQFQLTTLPIGIAIHTGEMTWNGSNYTGQAHHLATRMGEASRPGETILSQACWSCALEGEEFVTQIKPTLVITTLGTYESPATVEILQVFPEVWKERAAQYGPFAFLSASEKAQQELRNQLALLKEENEKLMEKLVNTEKKANEARDRAAHLHESLQEAQRSSQGSQANVQVALQEISHLINATEDLQSELKITNNRLQSARQVMTNMNGKLQSIAARNVVLEKEVIQLQSSQDSLRRELAQVEALLSGKKSPSRKSLLHMIIPTREKRSRQKTVPPRLSVSSDGDLRAVPIARAVTDEGVQLQVPRTEKKRRLSAGHKSK